MDTIIRINAELYKLAVLVKNSALHPNMVSGSIRHPMKLDNQKHGPTMLSSKSPKESTNTNISVHFIVFQMERKTVRTVALPIPPKVMTIANHMSEGRNVVVVVL